MGAFAAWLSGNFSVAPMPVDSQRTILVSDFEPSAESLTLDFGAPPHVIVLPAEPQRPLPGVTYYSFRTNTNPVLWDDAVDDAIRAGADTVAFLNPSREVRGKTLLRLRSLGVRRVLLPCQGRLRAYSPLLLALWRRIVTITTNTIHKLGGRDLAAMTEAQCHAVLSFAPPPSPAPQLDQLLRVAYFVTSLNSGGAERQVCNSAIGQKREGLDVRVLTRHALVGVDNHYQFIMTPHAIPVRRIGSRWHDDFPEAWQQRGLSLEPLQLLPTELRDVVTDLLGELLTDPVDVLHCFGDDSNVAGLIAAALAGVPAVILSFRNGNPTHFPGLLRPWMRSWYRAAYGRPGLMLSSNSEFGARDYESWLDIPSGSVPVVRNAFEVPPVPGRDDALRWRRELGLSPNVPVVAGIFRFQAEKRPLFFLECVDHLRRRIPDLRVVVAGVGELEPVVRATIAERGLHKVVQLLGQRRDIPIMLAGSDVLLLTSDVEGTPNVLLEAQHCGCVPVATAASGSREALLHGETGILVNLDDVAGAVDAVADLLGDPVKRLRMAAAGPAFVAERFSPAALLEGNLQLYRAALDATTPALVPGGSWEEDPADSKSEPATEISEQVTRGRRSSTSANRPAPA